jgi:hypothetical protein
MIILNLILFPCLILDKISLNPALKVINLNYFFWR